MNINEVLPSETLLSTLKRLETRGVVNARGVCKQWLQIIDGNKTFWRILTLRKQTLGDSNRPPAIRSEERIDDEKGVLQG